jgi:hypothetical protein
MKLQVHVTGDIVERQELLNGTQSITIEGASDDRAWTLVGSLSWNRGLVDYAGEGDLTLARGEDEVFATLTRSTVTDAPEGEDADHLIKLQYEIDGGAGAFAETTGEAAAEGSLAGDRFAGTWVLTLDSGR